MRFRFSNEQDFEREVRNVAKALWGPTRYSGSIVTDGKERDGIFEDETSIRVLEATTSKQAQNAFQNCQKLDKLVRRLRGRHPEKGVTGWYVTRFDATGEQGSVISDYNTVNHKSFDEFFAMIVNSTEYLRKRNLKPFGSIRHPTEPHVDATVKYVPTKIIDESNAEKLFIRKIGKNILRNQGRVLITGEYGVGKSMALRELFYFLESEHTSQRDARFPVYINLRDHIERFEPDECLRVHAKSVGLPNPEKLVSAWRYGYVHLLLDGFDELAPRIVTKSKSRASELRRSALTLIKRLIEETPQTSSIVVTGRSNYFDDESELHHAIGLKGNWKTYQILDLDETDLSTFVKEFGIEDRIPDWIPKKPLLLSYIFSDSDLKNDIIGIEGSKFVGWNLLIDRICEREVEQVYIALDPDELKRIYGRMATKARRKQDRIGPLTFDDCKEAFVEVTLVEPEERSITALLRLPGTAGGNYLGEQGDIDRGSRSFVDEEFADALASVDIMRLLTYPNSFDVSVFKDCNNTLDDLTIGIVAASFTDGAFPDAVNSALREISGKSGAKFACSDLVTIMATLDTPCYSKCSLEQLEFSELRFDGHASLGGIELSNCYIDELFCDCGVDDFQGLPFFNSCVIRSITYREGSHELLFGNFSNDCVIESKHQIVNSLENFKDEGLPDNYLDLCSIIDKVFIQSTRGRQREALFRSRPSTRRNFIESIISSLKRSNWIFERVFGGVQIVYPNKSKRVEALSVIEKRLVDHELIRGIE